MLSWRLFVVHDGVGHAAELPHLGVIFNEGGFHFWYQRAEVIQTLLVLSSEELARPSSYTR